MSSNINLVKPKLLTEERIIELFNIYDCCSQVFRGSPVLEIFCHIAALTANIRERDQQLLDMIRAETSDDSPKPANVNHKD